MDDRTIWPVPKNVIQRVGQCFAHVETCSYFPGDAFAVYADDFHVASLADVQLEFCTTQLNGALLSALNAKDRRRFPSQSAMER